MLKSRLVFRCLFVQESQASLTETWSPRTSSWRRTVPVPSLTWAWLSVMTPPPTLLTSHPIKGLARRGPCKRTVHVCSSWPSFLSNTWFLFTRIPFNSLQNSKCVYATGTWLQRFWMRLSTWDTLTHSNVLIFMLWGWSTGKLHAAVIVEVRLFQSGHMTCVVFFIRFSQLRETPVTSTLSRVIRYPWGVPVALLWPGTFWPFNRGNEKAGVWPKATAQHPKLVAELRGTKCLKINICWL